MPNSHNTNPTGKDVFEILVHQHADMLTAYLRTLVAKPDLVDDLFQETMLVAWRRLPDYDRTRPFAPWLRGIAAKLVLAHRRKSTRDLLSCEPAILEALEGRMQQLEKIPADSFADRLKQLHTCLEHLPEKSNAAIKLAYAQGLKLREIAASFSATEESIKKRIQRARALLQQCLGISSGETP